MKNRNDEYESSGIQNMFTAYLISAIQNTRNKYLTIQYQIFAKEICIDEIRYEPSTEFEEIFSKHLKEMSLYYLNNTSKFALDYELDDRLMIALFNLKEEERLIIFLHVFGELTFVKIAERLNINFKKVENMYYYAIRKMKREIKGDTYGV